MAVLGDLFAVASYGYYPTPTPTAAARAIFAVSYGLLGTAPTAVAVVGNRARGDWFLYFGNYSHYR